MKEKMNFCWNVEEYLNSQIEKIKNFKQKGHPDWKILDRNEFSFKAK